MAQRREIITVYAAGMVQGVGLVTFPATSAVFTSSTHYGLTSTEYGAMFVPQAIMAIVASLLGAGLRSRLGTQRIYLLGLLANLLAMTLLVASRFAISKHSLAYAILLVATSCMGVGFGFTVPALNTLAAAFFPETVDKAVLALNALLGLGTALAPAFVALFVGLGVWWGLPVLVGLLLFGLLVLSARESLNEAESSHADRIQKGKFPMRFWMFATFVLLYGVCETVNGNWASLYLTKNFKASPAMASLALTMFWSMVTAGRVLFAGLEKWFPQRLVWRALPFVVTGAFITGCLGAEKQFGARHFDICARGTRMFGAFAPGHQFWAERTGDHDRLGGWRPDRFLSDWLWHCRFWSWPFAILGWTGPQHHLRGHCDDCFRDGRAILSHYEQIGGAGLTFVSTTELTKQETS